MPALKWGACALVAAAVCDLPALARSASSADWPQWRGTGDGIAHETAWTSEGKELWTKELGLGYSTVSIAAGRLFTTGFDAERERDVIYCLDPVSGKELWRHEYPAKIMDELHTGGTLSTPSVDGETLYTINREGKFFAFKAADGKVVWERDLMKEPLGLELPKWGFSASPFVMDDMLVLNMGRVIAVEQDTGETIWATEKNYGAAYSTPAAFELSGEPRLAVFNGDGLVVLDAFTGGEVTFHEWKTQYDINAATPVVVDESKLFISSGLNRGCAMLDVAGEGAAVLWESKAMSTKMSGAVLIDGHLYGFDEGQLKCLDLDGKVKWAERGLGTGALLGAGDRLAILSEKGDFIVAEATPEAFKPLARERVFDSGVCWTTPVLLNGLVYLRNSEVQFVCRDHRE